MGVFRSLGHWVSRRLNHNRIGSLLMRKVLNSFDVIADWISESHSQPVVLILRTLLILTFTCLIGETISWFITFVNTQRTAALIVKLRDA